MNYSLNALLTLVLFFVGIALSYAQDTNSDAHDVTITIPEVALLDLETSGSSTLTLAPTAPTEAGSPISFGAGATDNSLWLNYSSIIGSTTEATRAVKVSITNGTVPGGLALKVAAGADAGNGEGTVGTAASTLTLSGSDQDLITAIGSCYTETGVSNGHQLTYNLDFDTGNYADLDFDESGTTLEITYTLTNN